jgi:dolichol-phosphate mannosyltransferase
MMASAIFSMDGAQANTAARQIDRARQGKVFVVLPAYNEEANLRQLLTRVREVMEEASLDYHVLVVDDGSRDGTPAILDELSARMPLTASRHALNQGLGATIRDGLEAAARTASPEDVIVTMDSDETHDPELIPQMVRIVDERPDVVIASRFQPGSRVFGLTKTRQVVSHLASLLCRISFPTEGVRDFTSGYRAYRASLLKRAFDHYGDGFIQVEGFQCMVDILLKLRRLDAIFGEVPLVLRYDLKQSASKMRVLRTARQTLVLLARRRAGLYDDG